MGIKDFFKKVGGFFGRVGKGIWNGVKKVGGFLGRIAKPVAKPILNGLSMLPGKLGLIGKVGSGVAEVANNVIDRIPNKDIQDKLHKVVDRGKDVVNKVQDKAQEVAGKVKPWADAGLGLINKPPSIKPITTVVKAPMAN